MGRPPSAPLAVSGSLENLAPRGEARDFIGLAMARNPSLQALSIEAEKTGLNLRLTRMGNLPDFSVGPSVEYFKDEQIFSVGASIILPVWNRKKGEIQTATAEQKRALAEITQQRLEIAGEVTKAASGLAVAHDQLALYQPAFLDKLRAFVRQAEEGYAQSATTLIIYLGSYNFSIPADTKNGENLLVIRDRRVAVSYMVEALRIFDHYHFRVAQKAAKKARKPFQLIKPPRKAGEKTWFSEDYTDPRKIRDRELFA
jgi:hypothetical protein